MTSRPPSHGGRGRWGGVRGAPGGRLGDCAQGFPVHLLGPALLGREHDEWGHGEPGVTCPRSTACRLAGKASRAILAPTGYNLWGVRSEERRVGEEGRSRWSP